MTVVLASAPLTRMLDSNSMSARRAAAAIVLAICLGAPIVELFETWDATTTGGDTELTAAIAAFCVGAAIAAATTLAAKLGHQPISVSRQEEPAVARKGIVSPLGPVPLPCIRPPTLLRI
jgi:hypothetical protein